MFMHFKAYSTEQNLFLADEFLITVLDCYVVTVGAPTAIGFVFVVVVFVK